VRSRSAPASPQRSQHGPARPTGPAKAPSGPQCQPALPKWWTDAVAAAIRAVASEEARAARSTAA
jgi:hypothetical protein